MYRLAFSDPPDTRIAQDRLRELGRILIETPTPWLRRPHRAMPFWDIHDEVPGWTRENSYQVPFASFLALAVSYELSPRSFRLSGRKEERSIPFGRLNTVFQAKETGSVTEGATTVVRELELDNEEANFVKKWIKGELKPVADGSRRRRRKKKT